MRNASGMTKSTIEILSEFEALRKRALDLEFYLHVDRHGIELRPGLMKAMPDRDKIHVTVDSMEGAHLFLDGLEWQSRYARSLGWDQTQAEKTWREERDRQRILDTLSRDS